MIVTFDAGILVRATKRSQGPARRVVDAIIDNPAHVIAISSYILGEVGRVLSYQRTYDLFLLSGEEIHAHVNFLRSVSEVVTPVSGRPVVLSDPKDDQVLYTAVAAGAEILCTRDRHFYDPFVTSFCQEHDLLVMNELELLKHLRQWT